MQVIASYFPRMPSAAENIPPLPVIPVQQTSNSSHQYVRLPGTLVARFNDAEPPHPWLPPQRLRLTQDTAVITHVAPPEYPRQQNAVVAAITILATHPEQLSAEQAHLLEAFCAGGSERLLYIARNMDYHATFNTDFGCGHVEFYGLPADDVRTPYTLKQAGFEYHRQDGQGEKDFSTTFTYHSHAWSCLRGVIKPRPLHANIPLHASDNTLLSFFTRAEQHIKASQNNEKIALAAIAKMLTGLLTSRPEWFSAVTAGTRARIISGADYPLLHSMMQLLPDKTPLLQRFTNNQYYEWREGEFRSTASGQTLAETSALARQQQNVNPDRALRLAGR